MKRILIVGATSAISIACAKKWASEGSKFFLVGRNSERLDSVRLDLLSRGADSVSNYIMDINDIEAHEEMIEHGLIFLEQIDLFFNATGTLPNQYECSKNIKYLLKEFQGNALSVIALIALVANQLEKQKCGTIAIITSVAGDRGRPSNYIYGSAKAAVSIYCEGLRAQLFKNGVHLLDIKPGFIKTPMTKDLDFPEILISTPDKAAICIDKALKNNNNIVYVPGFWFYIMKVIKSIPTFIFKRLNL
tara:strand:- start:5272 stop:6012 length:741 start_codon:yes stop_codon:yes gene_type:complete